jgi:hypothetical protein
VNVGQEQCRQEWGSEFPKPVKVGFQNGEHIIKFKNHEGDKNPSSFVLGNYRKLVIQGNNGPLGDWFLPDHMTAADHGLHHETMWGNQGSGRGMDVTSTGKILDEI